MDRSIIDAASVGTLRYMTPFEAKSLIKRWLPTLNNLIGVNDVGKNAVRQDKLNKKFDSLTIYVIQLPMNQQKPPLAKPKIGDHPEDFAANIYNNMHQNHPNLKWFDHSQPPQGRFQNNAGKIRSYVPPPIQQQRQHEVINNHTPPPGPSEPSLEELNYDKLPSQIVINPKNVSCITLRSDKQIEIPIPTLDPNFEKDDLDASKRKHPNTSRKIHVSEPSSSVEQQPFSIHLPFPPKFILSKKMEEVDKDTLDTLYFHYAKIHI
ncbi:hypothetical protein Lal_00013751 [Lupinus albus]|nr:hypothetical protein Lal_00013751 [Lupinus albus]